MNLVLAVLTENANFIDEYLENEKRLLHFFGFSDLRRRVDGGGSGSFCNVSGGVGFSGGSSGDINVAGFDGGGGGDGGGSGGEGDDVGVAVLNSLMGIQPSSEKRKITGSHAAVESSKTKQRETAECNSLSAEEEDRKMNQQILDRMDMHIGHYRSIVLQTDRVDGM